MSGPGALRIPTRREIADVARLAGPIVVVQVGIMAMGAVDAAMLGRVSPAAMAAGALGNFYWLLVTMVGQGTIQALDPLVAQAVGARDDRAVRHAVQRGLVVAVLLTLPASVLLWPGTRVLLWMGQPSDVAVLAGEYARATIPGTLGLFWFVALRQSVQAFGRTGVLIATIVLANLLNIVLDWVLIFGHLGAPAMGVRGAALATSIGRWAMCLILAGLGWQYLRPHIRGSWRSSLQVSALWQMLKLGLPIGVHQWLEIIAFGGALVLMGLFGTVPLAAHNITITIVALTYMVPLGTSAAAAVLVGHAIGRGDPEGARREASAALACGVGFMALSASIIALVPGTLAAVFSTEAEVVAMATSLLPIAAAFQVFDGIQGVASGILRGAGDTRVPMWLNLLGFGVVGLPVSALLAFSLGMGPAGVWWGLVVCLMVVAVLLAWRVHTRLGGALERVER